MRALSLCVLLILGACAHEPIRPVDHRDTPPARPGVTNLEAYSLIYSVVKTVQDPKWLRDPAIIGRCSTSLDPSANLEVPCQNVVIAAIDDKGQEKSRAPVDEGHFRLSVDTGKVYFLKVLAPLYRVQNDKHIGPLRAGETIDLRLSRK